MQGLVSIGRGTDFAFLEWGEVMSLLGVCVGGGIVSCAWRDCFMRLEGLFHAPGGL